MDSFAQGPAVPTALITGGSLGLGRALTEQLVRSGWHVVLDARDAGRLRSFSRTLPQGAVTAIPGDVRDGEHRHRLVQAAGAISASGGLDLLVNNASVLGPSPQPRLADYPLEVLRHVLEVNLVAPLALVQLAMPLLQRRAGRIVNLSSDAAVEPYPGWGGYGAAKAGLDQLTAVLAIEHADLRVYAFDPGDMATGLQQQAFPDEDVSDRPDPSTVVPSLLRLVSGELPSGRYRSADLAGGQNA